MTKTALNMKIKDIVSVILLVILSISNLKAEDNKYLISTDKDLYVSGDIIYSQVYLPELEKSKVIYLDLLDCTGKFILGAKLEVLNGEANGYLIIPDSLSTGTFFLRVTNNQTCINTCTLKEVYVYNRFEQLYVKHNIKKLEGNIQSKEKLEISCTNNQKNYQRREEVELLFQLPQEHIDMLKGNLMATVINQPPKLLTGKSILFNIKNKQISGNKGPSINGRILCKQTLKPLEGVLVFASIPDSIPFFDYSFTNKDGEFNFLMKQLYGEYELVLGVKGKSDNNYKLELNKETNSILDLRIKSVQLAEELNDYIDQHLQIAKLKKVFKTGKYNYQQINSQKFCPELFYGVPEYKIDPDDYFELKDFKELTKELLFPYIRYKEQNGRSELHVFNSSMNTFFKEKPLLILDGVPIDSLSLISSLATNEIDWIDVVTRDRFFGDLRFKGVFAIYTKSCDASKVPKSNQHIKINYVGYQNRLQKEELQSTTRNIPDFRQTLLWEPSILPQKEFLLKFKTSDVRGNFFVIVKGKTKEGKVLESIHKIKVN